MDISNYISYTVNGNFKLKEPTKKVSSQTNKSEVN